MFLSLTYVHSYTVQKRLCYELFIGTGVLEVEFEILGSQEIMQSSHVEC